MKPEKQVTNVGCVLQLQSQLNPDSIFIIDQQRNFTYGDTNNLVEQFAAYLIEKNITKGDVVATILFNSIDFVVVYNAIIRLGAIIAPIGFTLKSREVNDIINDCNPKLLICHSEIETRLHSDLAYTGNKIVINHNDLITHGMWAFIKSITRTNNIVTVAPNDPLGLLYSSGTTGEAKGVLLSHRNISTNMEAAYNCYKITHKDRTVLFLPLSHCFGLNAILNCITYSGASMVIMRKFSFADLLEILTHDTITMFFAVPFIYNLILQELKDDSVFDKTNYFFSAASKLALSTELNWENRFSKPIYQGYGLTETSPFATYVPREGYYPGSIGVPIADVQIEIVDGHRNVVPTETVGEIAVKGPNVMLGYYNKPELTANAIVDGWFYTGDIGYKGDDGLLYIVDRLKDMVIIKGENVYPSEVENVILMMPEVEDVAVYGVPDNLSEETVCAKIIIKKSNQLTVDEVSTFCKQYLAPFKVPTQIYFVPQLPKSASGKLLKRLLREEDLL